MFPQVTFRGVLPTESVVEAVWRGAHALGKTAPRLHECHVVIERLARGSRGRGAYRVTVHVSGKPQTEVSAQYATGDDVLGALASALDASRRTLRARQGALFAKAS